jgi:hypothetical protein
MLFLVSLAVTATSPTALAICAVFTGRFKQVR